MRQFAEAFYDELKGQIDRHGDKPVRALCESLNSGEIKPAQLSLRPLAEALMGREWVAACNPRYAGSTYAESAGAVDTTMFSNVLFRSTSTMIMESYQNEEFKASKLIPNKPTNFLNGERIPGSARLADETEEVGEGKKYPVIGFGEDYQDTPVTTKNGLIVGITKEMVWGDRWGIVTTRASEVGEILGLNKEKRLLDMVIGVTNNYKWRDTSYGTYQTTTPWVNVKATNPLVDYTDVDNVDQLFADMLDPNTNEPILIGDNMVSLVTPKKRVDAARVFGAPDYQYVDNQAAAGTVRQTARNPFGGEAFEVSRLMYRRIIASGVSASDAAKWWFRGNFAKAFAYMEAWPITVVNAPSNSEPEFTQDVVFRVKASERGAAAVMNPRYVVKSYDA